jgi:hypothetical protein
MAGSCTISRNSFLGDFPFLWMSPTVFNSGILRLVEKIRVDLETLQVTSVREQVQNLKWEILQAILRYVKLCQVTQPAYSRRQFIYTIAA